MAANAPDASATHLLTTPVAPLVPDDLRMPDAKQLTQLNQSALSSLSSDELCAGLRSRLDSALAALASPPAAATPTPLVRLEADCAGMLSGAVDANPLPLLREARRELQSSQDGLEAEAAAAMVVAFCQERLLRNPASLASGDASGDSLPRRRCFDMQAQLRLGMAGLNERRPTDPLVGSAYRDLKKILQMLGVQLGVQSSLGVADSPPQQHGHEPRAAQPSASAAPPRIAAVRSVAQYVQALLWGRFGDALPQTLEKLRAEFDDEPEEEADWVPPPPPAAEAAGPLSTQSLSGGLPRTLSTQSLSGAPGLQRTASVQSMSGAPGLQRTASIQSLSRLAPPRDQRETVFVEHCKRSKEARVKSKMEPRASDRQRKGAAAKRRHKAPASQRKADAPPPRASPHLPRSAPAPAAPDPAATTLCPATPPKRQRKGLWSDEEKGRVFRDAVEGTLDEVKSSLVDLWRHVHLIDALVRTVAEAVHARTTAVIAAYQTNQTKEGGARQLCGALVYERVEGRRGAQEIVCKFMGTAGSTDAERKALAEALIVRCATENSDAVRFEAPVGVEGTRERKWWQKHLTLGDMHVVVNDAVLMLRAA